VLVALIFLQSSTTKEDLYTIMEDKSAHKSEISKNLFEQISWQDMMRLGELKSPDHQLLVKSQNNLGLIVDHANEISVLVTLLLKLATSSNLTLQQYAFSRIEEILGLGGLDYSDSDADAFGSKNSRYFTNAQGDLNDGSFLRGLDASDYYVKKSAALSLAFLLSVCDDSASTLINWMRNKLSSNDWDTALPALTALVKGGQTRKEELVQAGVVSQAMIILKKLGRNGNAQHIYEITFVIWTLSLGIGSGIDAFKSTGVVSTLVDLLSASPSRKVTRMAVAALRNLCATEDDAILTEMLGLGLLKVVETAKQSFKLIEDAEVESDFKYVQEILTLNFRELSTFDRWAAEVRSGALKWGILHTEKFWRENAKFVEGNDFALLKDLIALLEGSGKKDPTESEGFVDPTAVCVALFDLGEFTRFYPNGRVVVSKLGGKDLVMQMLQRSSTSHEADSGDSPFDHPEQGNAEIEKHSLQCISKLMVTNWEFLR
jgi:V-type H+-transporting ATPase subunit H